MTTRDTHTSMDPTSSPNEPSSLTAQLVHCACELFWQQCHTSTPRLESLPGQMWQVARTVSEQITQQQAMQLLHEHPVWLTRLVTDAFAGGTIARMVMFHLSELLSKTLNTTWLEVVAQHVTPPTACTTNERTTCHE